LCQKRKLCRIFYKRSKIILSQYPALVNSRFISPESAGEVMAGNPKQKLKLLYIYDYLRRHSDESHPASVSDIIEYLAGNGVTAERKSIYNDIEVLREYGLTIERGTTKQRGYYLKTTGIKRSELMLLADAVYASPVISQKKTAALIEKLCDLVSIYQAKAIMKQYQMLTDVTRGNMLKTDNEELYKNIETIHTAMLSGKKIRFMYHRRVLANNLPVFDSGREFTISPYAAMWNQDKYYIVGNYEKYDDLSHYRIDRMKKVTLIDENIRPLREVSAYKTKIDTADYARRVFNMFAGAEPSYVELDCDIKLLETIIERFGINVPYRQTGTDRFTVKAYAVINDGFEKWLLNLGGGVVVRAPQELRASMIKRLEAMLQEYRSIK